MNESETRVCPTCESSEYVEDSVDPEHWEGYCYRCMAPFIGPFTGLQRVEPRQDKR